MRHGPAAADPRRRRTTMDFVYIDDVARANVLALQSDVSDEVFNVASGTETSLNDLAAALLRVMGSHLAPEYGPERKVNPVSRRLADTGRPRRCWASRPGRPGRRLAPPGFVVASKQGRHGMIPITKPVMDSQEADAARRVILSGWITQGPEVAAFETRVRRVRRRPPCLRGFELHDRAAPGPVAAASSRATRSSRSATPSSRPPTRSAIAARAGVRRHRARRPSTSTRSCRGRHHAAHAGDPLRAPDRHALRPAAILPFAAPRPAR